MICIMKRKLISTDEHQKLRKTRDQVCFYFGIKTEYVVYTVLRYFITETVMVIAVPNKNQRSFPFFFGMTSLTAM